MYLDLQDEIKIQIIISLYHVEYHNKVVCSLYLKNAPISINQGLLKAYGKKIVQFQNDKFVYLNRQF